MSQSVDLELKNLLLRELPADTSYRTHAIILSSNCVNDLVKLILERAKLRIIDATDAFFRKVEIRVPFEIEPSDVARLLRQYEGVSDIQCVKAGRVSDLDFQVHKNAMIQQSILNICRADAGSDDDTSVPQTAYFDGFEPADFGLFYATKPSLSPMLTDRHGQISIPDNSFAVVNLFDSRYTITELYIAFNQDRLCGSELFLIVPYDVKMWTVSASNILEGSYSYQWTISGSSLQNEQIHIKSDNLPIDFFDNRLNDYELRIRPYGSNKILRITRDEFLGVFCSGSEACSFPETRRIAHGFAEVSIINFYPILNEESKIDMRYNKRAIIPYNKKIVKRRIYNVSGFIPVLNFAKALEPPWEYIIDEKLYDRTRKAAVQTRISRNLIVPLIYHLFSHSTHIVFNGAIVTLQKVMSPELICQLTEYVLFDVIPIKIKILQAGNAIKANSLSGSNILATSLKSLLIHAYEKSKDSENVARLVSSWINDPRGFIEENEKDQQTRTYNSAASSSLPIIHE